MAINSRVSTTYRRSLWKKLPYFMKKNLCQASKKTRTTNCSLREKGREKCGTDPTHKGSDTNEQINSTKHKTPRDRLNMRKTLRDLNRNSIYSSIKSPSRGNKHTLHRRLWQLEVGEHHQKPLWHCFLFRPRKDKNWGLCQGRALRGMKMKQVEEVKGMWPSSRPSPPHGSRV